MGGGTLQLVAYGGQDIHIIETPNYHFLNQFTEDIPILRWNVSNKIC